jgi:hypothetical protein
MKDHLYYIFYLSIFYGDNGNKSEQRQRNSPDLCRNLSPDSDPVAVSPKRLKYKLNHGMLMHAWVWMDWLSRNFNMYTGYVLPFTMKARESLESAGAEARLKSEEMNRWVRPTNSAHHMRRNLDVYVSCTLGQQLREFKAA